MRMLFGENVCENERIGSRLGEGLDLSVPKIGISLGVYKGRQHFIKER